MQVKKFRKKPVEIEAIQWTGDNLKEVLEFAGEDPGWDEVFSIFTGFKKGGDLKVITNHGPANATVGDWIIKGSNGEFYPCKPGLFGELYDEVVTDPKNIDIEKNTPHLVINCGATVHVLPLSVIENIAHGSMSIMDVEMWDPIFRKVFEEWMQEDGAKGGLESVLRDCYHVDEELLIRACRSERSVLSFAKTSIPKFKEMLFVIDAVSKDWAKRKLNEYASGVEG